MFKEILDNVGKHFHHKSVKTTSLVFKLLTRITVNLCLCSALLISLKQFFGDPMKCHVDSSAPRDIVEAKCWIDGVYVDKNLLEGNVGKDIVRWGVGPARPDYPENFVYQKFYQWIVPVLALQALIFYLPRILWHIWENGLMYKLLGQTDSLVINEKWTEQKNHIVRFLKEVPKKQHRMYIIKYVICEIFGAGVLIFNMHLMHWVFNDFWTTYRPAIFAILRGDLIDFSRQSAILFPTQAKCFYHYFGASGSNARHDALCLLPQNIISEKIFVFLYLWLSIMVVLTVLNFCTTFVILTFKCLRIRDLHRMANRSKSTRTPEFFYHYSDFGYWFMLHLLHRNLSPILFKDLMTDLMKVHNKRFEKTKSNIHTLDSLRASGDLV